MECGAPVGGTISYPCDLPLPRGHDGPCRSVDNEASVRRRKAWEANQVVVAGSAELPAEPAKLRLRPGDQPLPVPNDRLLIHDLVAADIQARKELGTRRYGTPLQPFNGRDALLDAYQEALDLAVYLKQAIVERDTPPNAQSAPQ